MNNSADQWDRREFLRGAALAGTAGLVGLRPDRALAEPPPETTGSESAFPCPPRSVARQRTSRRPF